MGEAAGRVEAAAPSRRPRLRRAPAPGSHPRPAADRSKTCKHQSYNLGDKYATQGRQKIEITTLSANYLVFGMLPSWNDSVTGNGQGACKKDSLLGPPGTPLL